jgi:hypothetical protein
MKCSTIRRVRVRVKPRARVSHTKPVLTASLGEAGGRAQLGRSGPTCVALNLWLPLPRPAEKGVLMLRTALVILLVLMLLGALPAWPYSHAWGYYPSGGLGLLLLILLIVMFLG